MEYGLALCGGLLIGFSSSAHLLANGRVTGISGILGGVLLFPKTEDIRWRTIFLSGLVLGGIVSSQILPDVFGLQSLEGYTSLPPNVALAVAVFAGVMVGIGTRLGTGCTSGHGVCGLPRYSIRSTVNVATFMTTGFLTASVAGKLFPLLGYVPQGAIATPLGSLGHFPSLGFYGTVLVSGLLVLLTLWWPARGHHHGGKRDGAASLLLTFGSGLFFGFGLAVSGMLNTNRLLSFLDPFTHNWNPSMILVMAAAVGLNTKTFPAILSREGPLFLEKFDIVHRKDITTELVAGGALFGVGWGLSGMCPGPALASLSSGDPFHWAFLVSLLAGMHLFHLHNGH